MGDRIERHGQILNLGLLPCEIILLVLSLLDIPDLHALALTTHALRTLSTDPLLHTMRLHRASLSLSHRLEVRPSLADLMAHQIYITRTTSAARSLGRNLIKIKLNRQLGRRPSVETLVEMGVLPSECYGKGGKGGFLAPGLVGIKRRVERERVKDVLRGWVGEGRGKRMIEMESREVETKPDVRRLARRFREKDASNSNSRPQQRWGREARKEKREEPTRAKVLGLRRFWEKVGQSSR
ncbi:hypothetical protein BJ875DRAFT_50578 [Amylocarpus encephaloides]|uniref:F-box domain-containing protein n=1 Tax=Amylocarpus encephaloides TaxID=45428 RepID=A0A9P8C4L1_9HELO|nr:hypothetical protein BJ875DRAFT_50578 [Amylocarpus encephaloides]